MYLMISAQAELDNMKSEFMRRNIYGLILCWAYSVWFCNLAL